MDTAQLEQLTLHVCDIARRAGDFICQERLRFQADRIERKHAHDYVSYVDKQSEQLIVGALRQLLPQAGFITEENTAAADDAADCSMKWVVDPLDGTTNFIHNYQPYAVSIGLMQTDGTILSGVVYDVSADEIFYAWKGGGAYTNGHQPLHVSSMPLSDALVCFQLPYDSEAYSPVIRRLIELFYGRVASVRMIGSAAIALCYVAAGRLDAYAEKYIGQWDFMAGALIVAEAGGCTTDYDGSSRFTNGNSIVATNGIVHADILAGIAFS